MKYNKKIVDNWELAINRALKTGKGKYGKFTFVGDLFDYKAIIKLIRQGKLEDAWLASFSLDTSAREEIPMQVWKMLEKANDA